MSYDPGKYLGSNIAAIQNWVGSLSLLHLKDERTWQDALDVRCINELIWFAQKADDVQARLTERIIDLVTELRVTRAELQRMRELSEAGHE